MSTIFPEELPDPWSEPSVPPSQYRLDAPLPPLPKQESSPVPETSSSYLYDLVGQNEELAEAVANIRGSSIPSTYLELYSKYIRNDGLVDFIAVESILEKTSLNQISIENVLNLVTLNQQLAFTTVDRHVFYAILGLIALEQEKLGSGNFQQLNASSKNLPDLVLSGAPDNSGTWDLKEGVSLLKISDPSADNAALRNNFDPTAKDIIKVVEIPEKEGLVFKHINYLVAHSVTLSANATNKKVVRRYSDFAWLYEVLLTKYPFRMLPSLPPKKFTGASNDALFLERRKRGLNRFINLVMKHPVLAKEAMVIIFLTVPAELTLWRKQTNVEVIEEFEGKRISKKFISDWSPNNVKIWAHAEKSLAGIQHQWEKVTLLVERFERRKQLYNNDNLKLVQVLGSLSLEPIYTVQPSDVSSIDQGLRGVARHLTTSSSLIQDETQLIEDGILSEFKEYNEYLVCLAGLFERNHRLGGNRIEEIKKKVEASQARLIQLKKKSDAKGSDIDALVSTINEDKQEIIRQSNRDWLIKECILQEFSLFQQTQYKVSKLFQEWVADRLKYSELHCENWSQLGELLQEMPTNHE